MSNSNDDPNNSQSGLNKPANTRFVTEADSPEESVGPLLNTQKNVPSRKQSLDMSANTGDVFVNRTSIPPAPVITVSIKRRDNSAVALTPPSPIVPKSRQPTNNFVPLKPPQLVIENSNFMNQSKATLPGKSMHQLSHTKSMKLAGPIVLKPHGITRANSMVDYSSPTNPSPTRTIRTLNKPDRAPSRRIGAPPRASEEHPQNLLAPHAVEKCDPWRMYVALITCCFSNCCLNGCGMKSKQIRHAWREKIALCSISAVYFFVLLYLIRSYCVPCWHF